MNQPTKDPSTPSAIADTFQLPTNWSAEQALAVWECLNALTNLVWECYQPQLLEYLQAELDAPNANQLDLFDPDDDIPF